MKKIIVCVLAVLCFGGIVYAEALPNLRGFENQSGQPVWNPVMPIGYPPSVIATNSNTIQCTESAYKLCIDVNGSMDTITMEDSHGFYTMQQIKQYIDSKKLDNLITVIGVSKEADTDVFDKFLAFSTNYFDGYIQIVDTANTTTETSYDTYASQVSWKTGSSTYCDSDGRVGWIEIDTHTAKVLGSSYATCTWTSVVFDRGAYSNYNRLYNYIITISDSQSTGLATATYYVRTNTSSAYISSAPWVLTSSGSSYDGDTRYLQMMVVLTMGDTNLSNPGVDTITIISYAYVLTGDKLFYVLGLDTDKHWGTAPHSQLVVGDTPSPVSKDNPLPMTFVDADGNTFTFNMYRGKAVVPVIAPLAMIVNEGKLFEACLGSETVTATSTHTYLVRPNGNKLHIVFNFVNSDGVIISIYDSPTLDATQAGSISLPIYNRDFTSSETIAPTTAWSNLTITDSGTLTWFRRYVSAATGATENQNYALEWITERDILVYVNGTGSGYFPGSIVIYKE
ncbi:MAG: hypothetical protein PHY56_00020 [Candidatus Omnitrophica bacterium]|nr:hypothetical protein [Candidatus Omnitrophota bacterium]